MGLSVGNQANTKFLPESRCPSCSATVAEGTMPLLKLRVQLKKCHSRHQDNILVSGTDLQTDAEEPSKLPQRKLVLLAMFSRHPWWEKPLTCFLFLQCSETPPSCSVTTADSSLSITFPHRLHREPHFAVGFRIPTGKGQLVSSCS